MVTASVKVLSALAVLLAVAPAALCASYTSVAVALQRTTELSQFAALLKQYPDVRAQLDEGFTGTILAPNNKAMANLKLAAAAAGVKLTSARWKQILLYAIVSTAYNLNGLEDGADLPNLLNKDITIRYVNGVATFIGIGSRSVIADGAMQIDVRTGGLGADGNAVIQIMSTVLLPFKLPHGVQLSAAGVTTPGGDDVVKAATLDGTVHDTSVPNVSSDVVNAVQTAINTTLGAVNTADQTVSGVAGSVGSAIGSAAGTVGGAVGSAAGAVSDGLNSAAGAVTEATGGTEAVGGTTGSAVAGAGAPGLGMLSGPAEGPAGAPAMAPTSAATPDAAPDAAMSAPAAMTATPSNNAMRALLSVCSLATLLLTAMLVV